MSIKSSLFFLVALFLIEGTAFAEGLSDVKIEKLQKPAAVRTWGRDPFEMPERIAPDRKAGQASLLMPFKIDGIISDGKKFLVIINGGFYRKNERVNDFLIKDVVKGRVILERNGEKYYRGIDKFAVEGEKKGLKK